MEQIERSPKKVRPEPSIQQPPEQVTPRAFLLGLLTIVALCLFAENYGRGLVRSFIPATAQIMFVAWVGIYLLMKLTRFRFALTRTELLMIFGMAWLVGTLPGLGLVGKMVADITGPAYFSSSEDRFWEVVGPHMPGFLFFEQGDPAVDLFYLGLKPGESIPWGAWFTKLYWWFIGTLGLVMAGFFASVLFFKQWAEKERLAFPLAHCPLELLNASEGRRVPDIFRNRIFWIGFACMFGKICYDIAGYFILDLPKIRVMEHRMYNDVPVALLQMTLLFIIYFGMAKYAAATGFVFLRVPGNKGVLILKSILGTADFSPRNLIGMMIVDRHGLAGHPIRMLSIPATAHVFRMLGNALKRHPLIFLALPVSLLVGYTVQCWANVSNVHTWGGMNVGMPGVWIGMQNQIPTIEGTELTYFDSEKLFVWIFGGIEAVLLTILASRYAAWPIHPLGVAFPTNYGFSAFLVWLPKFIVLRVGGVSLYRRSIPFWYGIVFGYLVGIWASKLVDITFFPFVRGYGTAHTVHEQW